MIKTVDKPLVSIIIPNYNYGRFISEAIDSALNQTYERTEVIVVDDGSTDNSREVIASYGDKIISVLKENGGQTSAFNAGFAASHGDIICFLDSDDILLPDKVVEVVNVFDHHQDIGWCFHPLQVLDESNNKLCGSYPKSPPYNSLQGIDFRVHIRRGKMPTFDSPTSGECFTRSLLQLILPGPEIKSAGGDLYIKYVAIALSKGFFLNKDLVIQRIHGNNDGTLLNNDRKRQIVSARHYVLYVPKMRSKFPELMKICNKLFGMAIGSFWGTGGIEINYKEIVNNYLSSVSLLERLEIYARAFYHYLKLSLNPRLKSQ